MQAADPTRIRLLGAGSLRLALGEIAEGFSRETGIEVETLFGPSGLLREKIERGERFDLFASADMHHPGRLAAAGLAASPVLFARNRICILARNFLAIGGEGAPERLLDPEVRICAPAPISDPGGDY
ncbi:MAG: substrate-binding domain-containing protein, partial [Deltaproteobacteria bacterium]|nr:substrate-binding domain-containing protein [Deltaproteobacteria bacterium]